ncbi:hypothetical protein UK23_06250 [Lentzea aerocolonigenes]|uniref:Glutamate/phenylalanine/leucine/valine/L-tryptophan dehydrogenase C-terminal domain-containing protein n=1 Tax=Lentzea aerocolonigenes TaxID=68170 RepID=A0A0F0HA37_LENAE|nr:hypothetical protein UK23_06250 [Lentzea aerocolonigenes]
MTELFSPGLQAWVAVDSLVDGMAMGGTRMTGTVSRQEVAQLARAMSTKLALAGLPIGGAKAGIRVGTGDRETTLRAFGRVSSPLLHGGVYLGCDLGITHADRDLFLAEAGYDVAQNPRVGRLPVDWGTLWTHLADITGFGVCEAAAAAIRTRFGSRPCRVAIQGFGTVGRAVAKSLAERGHSVVAVADIRGTVEAREGLPVGHLLDLTDSAGVMDRTRMPDGVTVHGEPEAWLGVDADVLVLAADVDAIRADNVRRVTAEVVVEGGNLCCTAEAKEMLAGQGVLLIPDVVANVGAAAATGCVLTGTVPFGLALKPMVNWMFDWVGLRVRENTEAAMELIAGGVTDPVPHLLAQRRTAW